MMRKEKAQASCFFNKYNDIMSKIIEGEAVKS